MFPTQEKKPHRVTSLTIDEISLCTAPANSEVVNGRKIPRSTVAIWKMDSDPHPGDDAEQFRGERYFRTTKKQEVEKVGFKTVAKAILEKVSKSAGYCRSDMEKDVLAGAKRLSAERGKSIEKCEARLWKADGMQARYETLAPAVANVDQRTFESFTKSEIKLDDLTRRRMKATGESFHQAYKTVTDQHPQLVMDHEREKKTTGQSVLVPVPSEYHGGSSGSARKSDLSRLTAAADDGNGDDGDECPSCHAEVDEDDLYCSNCGADLAKARKTSKRGAA